MRVEKSVFISYRRTSTFAALAVFQALRSRGFDAFFDYASLDSGSFERAILGEVRARAHFLIVLLPDTLIRCSEPGDWVRREIELAIETQRNIVPLTFEGFDWKAAAPLLTGKLALLSGYQALNVPADFFEEAMDRLAGPRYLSRALDLVLHPTPAAQQGEVRGQIAAAAAPKVTEKQLTAADHVARGDAHYLRGDPAGAVAEYERAIALDPTHADAWNNRGLIRDDQGAYAEAVADYTEAIRLNPTFAIAWNNRANARDSLGDYAGAIADASEALRIRSGYTEAWNNRGVARLHNQDLDGAIGDFTEAIRLNPAYSMAWNNRALVYYEQRQFDRTIADTSESIRLNPKNAQAYSNRGNARDEQGDYDGAIADYSEAIRLNPKNPFAWNNRGVARRNKRDYAGAIADFTEAIRLRPSYARAYFNRAGAREASGDRAGAQADREAAAAIDPQRYS